MKRPSVIPDSVFGGLILLPIILLILLFPIAGFTADGSNVSAWLKRCGGQSPESMRTRRVQSIFERVKSASDAAGKQSKIYILECDGWPWAATLQDRNIILTRGAIEAIYGSDDPIKSKDARMAFVLGHELKHVLEDDFWHEKVRKQQFMSGNALSNYGEMAKERRRHDERRADEDGFIYASLAGFDMREILRPVRGEDNFLADWARQTGSLSGDTHFLPSERTEHLKRKFQSLDNAVEFFKFGVRLAHFGRYNEARILLENFQNIFPSAQVYNNLGYIYLQMARAEMPPELAYRYWFPLVMDFDSGIPDSPSRNIDIRLPKKAKLFLDTAVRLLRNGLDQHKDQGVAINLVAALMYLGEHSAAQATIETIDGWERDPQLVALDAIALLQNKRLKNPWDSYSRENFASEALKADAATHIIYNYARALKEHGLNDQAKTQFTRLKSHLHTLPINYRILVCREIAEPACTDTNENTEISAQWILDIKPGDDIDTADTRERLKNWKDPVKDKLDGIDAKIFTHDNGNSLLALNGVVELLNIKQHTYDYKDHLLSDNGSPQNVVLTIGGDSVLSYGEHWSAVVSGQEVREIWVAR